MRSIDYARVKKGMKLCEFLAQSGMNDRCYRNYMHGLGMSVIDRLALMADVAGLELTVVPKGDEKK